jgi:hypothetical protein
MWFKYSCKCGLNVALFAIEEIWLLNLRSLLKADKFRTSENQNTTYKL